MRTLVQKEDRSSCKVHIISDEEAYSKKLARYADTEEKEEKSINHPYIPTRRHQCHQHISRHTNNT